jgi:ComEC/Rec2-related protein
MRTLIMKRPLAGAAILFALGAHLGVILDWPAQVYGIILVGCSLVSIKLLHKGRDGLAVIAVLLIICGAALSGYHRDKYADSIESFSTPIRRAKIQALVVGESRLAKGFYTVPIIIQASGDHEVKPFRAEFSMRKHEDDLPKPGTVIQTIGSWSPAIRAQYPDSRERHGFLGKITVKSWTVIGEKSTIISWLYKFKSRLKSIGKESLSSNGAGVLHGMLYGEDLEDEGLKEAMRDLGVAHLLSVSGLHVGFMVLLFLGVGMSLGIPKKVLYALVLIILPLFVLMVGSKASAIRAAIMTGLALIGRIIERRVDGLNLCGAAALIMLVFRPLDLYDPGFQLSFAACCGIFVYYPCWRSKFDKPWRSFVEPWLVSLAAQVGVFPIAALYFGTVTWMGVLINPIIVPLGSLVVQLGWVAELLGAAWFPFSQAINAVNEWVIWLMISLIIWLSKLGTAIRLPNWNLWCVLGFYASLVGLHFICRINPLTGERRRWLR